MESQHPSAVRQGGRRGEPRKPSPDGHDAPLVVKHPRSCSRVLPMVSETKRQGFSLIAVHAC